MEQTTKYGKSGVLLQINSRKSVLMLKIKFPKDAGSVKNIFLTAQNEVTKIAHPMDCQIQNKGKNMIIRAKADLSRIALDDRYWNVFAELEKDGKKLYAEVLLKTKLSLCLILRNYHCTVDKFHICFPMRGKNGLLTLSYRLRSPYDGYGTRLKEFFAFGLYILLLPYWKKRRIWLVYEKYCSMAQDNGYYFFKYCMENLTNSENKHIYYVLDTNSDDWKRIRPYEKQVIPFMSIRHMLYSMAADIYVASDSKKHLYTWRSKPNFITNRISKHDILFLQHGVTALKRVDQLFGKESTSSMTYFTTTSEFEQNIVVRHFGYSAETAPILGFARWDVLKDASRPDKKIILAMPTWRSWLEDRSPEKFQESDYYKNYMELLQNKRLGQILKDHDIKLIFYIHPKFKNYLNEFNVHADHVELIPFGTLPLNELLKQCSLLVTDYSSVCWDVYYLGKPVLFYQFDYALYSQYHGSYLDMEHDLFGDRYTECDALINGIEEYIKNNFAEKESYARMREHYFSYHDTNNSQRIYEYIIKKGY